ncbi:hypothetical protein CHL78_012120 [Romboutsia weinsteinii]|uniref:Uncharacterized protein n=1 Tax=Romboutsia weinsteinii TaxID=2020949 RepID=A0A371J206_9FIRM|nr:hypothetical protein [Romboutsia weinsteinii]RDY26810.1 hypothetical protein CHL78_012120 [Romboutsia weinsteinii]
MKEIIDLITKSAISIGDDLGKGYDKFKKGNHVRKIKDKIIWHEKEILKRKGEITRREQELKKSTDESRIKYLKERLDYLYEKLEYSETRLKTYNDTLDSIIEKSKERNK